MDATAEERGFLQLMRDLEIGDGFTLPCYGPNGRDGYVGIGRMTEHALTDTDALREMHLAAQAAHLRICEFKAGDQADDRPLSGREREVLDWPRRHKAWYAALICARRFRRPCAVHQRPLPAHAKRLQHG